MSADTPYLEVTNGSMKGVQFRLVGESAMIGRGSDCDIILEDVKGVSRNHAQVFVSGGRLRVVDQDSANGTFVDGNRVAEAQVPSGSTIKIGQAMLRVVFPGEDASVPVSAGKRPTTRRSSRSLRPASGGAPATTGGDYIPGEAIASESLMLVAGKSSQRFFFTALTIVVVLLGGMYAIKVLLDISIPPLPPYRGLEAREMRVVAVNRSFDGVRVEGKTADNNDVVEAKLFGEIYSNRYGGMLARVINKANDRVVSLGYTPVNFVVLNGISPGEAKVYLILNNTPVGVINVIVRGIRPPFWPERMTEGEKRDLAEQFVRQSIPLAESKSHYYAMKKLAQAMELYREVRDRKGLLDAQKRYSALKDSLQNELEKIFQSAMADAFPDRRVSNEDLYSCFRKLESAQRLVPDEESLDWQALEAWKGRIRGIINRR